MPDLATDVVWKKRLEQIPSAIDEIHFPEVPDGISQDSEWCEVVSENESKRIRFHDYDQVFDLPGLYEEIFYERLKCCSPSYIVKLLEDVATEYEGEPEKFRVLDVGAGNGMVGDELQQIHVDAVVGIDIIPAAKEAAHRDRPEVYDDYRVADLTNLSEPEEERLRHARLNCLTTVAALGFGDIPPKAFVKALDLIATTGWLAFNLKEDFLQEDDPSGFSKLIRQLSYEGYVKIYCYRRYQHRVSVTGEPLYYVAMIARKLKDVDSDLLSSMLDE